MADQPKPKKEFTHIGVEKRTQKKVALLAQVLGPRMFELVELWADEAWKKAVKKGLVTDAMLTAHWVGDGSGQKSEGGKK